MFLKESMSHLSDIYEIGVSLEEEYPSIDWGSRDNKKIDNLMMARMLDGDLPINYNFFNSLNIDISSDNRFDVLDVSVRLLVSSKAKNYIESFSIPNLEFVLTRVNNTEFYNLIVKNVVDCLDKQNSEIAYFRSNPTKIKRIKRYKFNKQNLNSPSIFRLPEVKFPIFVTEDIKNSFEVSDLVGFRFTNYENPPSGALLV